ncbi:Histone acetyltransferase type B catalytic subunit [Zea mays]|uniref:Histone acetyltransferase type B catalytic subunit n=2 Tax=Zea mays TaxID=4577 RepID=A0A1D6HUB6_MAIZE|nr:Histone acetyltransferase type B catalytic subunit [Zea mays]
MSEKFDLLIVGRRGGEGEGDPEGSTALTSGLSESSEFPELGVLGDMLASAEFASKVSILVIQQQPPKKTIATIKLFCFLALAAKRGLTDWEGGYFPVTLHFTENYPSNPPTCKFPRRGHDMVTFSYCYRTAVTNGGAIKHDGSYESDPAVEILRISFIKDSAALRTLEDLSFSKEGLFELNSKVLLHFFYSRLVPLVLLLVEGSTPIDIGEHGWEMLLVVKKATQEAGSKFELLGFAAVHNFYHYPESIRLRISQGEGHGLGLLEAINYIAQSENIYDVTIESPSDYLQYVRSSVDCLCLLMFDPIKPALGAIVSSLKETNLSKRAQSLRMDHKSMDNFRACIYDLMKGEILGSASGTNRKRLLQMPTSFNKEASFVVYWTHEIGDEDEQTVEQQPEYLRTQEQQLNELVDIQIEEIDGVAKNVTSCGKDKMAELAVQ